MRKVSSHLFNGLEQIEKVGFPLILFLVMYGFFLALVNQSYYQGIYTLRNGFICSLQQMLLFVLVLLSVYRSYRFGFLKKDYKVLFSWLFFLILFTFGLGEKMRWGQFIFELPISEFFQKHNTQGQITIHNLRFGDFSVNKVIFGSFLAIVVFFYSLIFPFLYSRGNMLARLVGDRLTVPVPKKVQIIWYLIIVTIALLIPDPKRGELVQLAGVWSFTMFFAFPKNINSLRG